VRAACFKYSPAGALLQVQYANQAVLRGSLALVVAGDGCVALCVASEASPFAADTGKVRYHTCKSLTFIAVN
jgi:20S proteasome alpha/beta subunit